MTPEQQTRQEIDKQLEAAGWIVQDHRDLHLDIVSEVQQILANADHQPKVVVQPEWYY